MALTVSFGLHLAIIGYLAQARFEPRYRVYAEDVTSVELVRPIPPPPPPPPPPTPETPPPRTPPKLQPRPPVQVTALPADIPPLPVPPVVQRVEAQAPPVATPAPAPPPAAPAPPRPAVVLNPDWLRRPTAEEVARYYPARAARMNIEGRATITCSVDAKGGLAACRVVSETPQDQDFGDAALRMTRLFKMRPLTRDGAPVAGGEVRIPIRFVLPEA